MEYLKICIIGSSGHVHYALDGIRDDNNVDIVGVAPGSRGEDIEGLITRINNLGYSPDKFNDFREMLGKLKPDIAVVNCYFGDQAWVTMEALKQKVHVFVEKPIATTFKELKLLRESYEQAGVSLAAMFGLRYTPWFLTAREKVKQGAIGEIRLMNAQKSYKLGSRESFYKKRATYGGTIPWVGSHPIDWFYWFTEEKFNSVFASHSTKCNNEHGELETTALCQFVFSNEVLGTINIDYLRPQNAPTHGDDRLRIAGTEGVIEVIDNKVFLINEKIDGERELPLVSDQNIFVDFINEVRGEGTCMVSAEDSFLVTEACLKARQSADERRIVYFD